MPLLNKNVLCVFGAVFLTKKTSTTNTIRYFLSKNHPINLLILKYEALFIYFLGRTAFHLCVQTLIFFSYIRPLSHI